MEHMADKMVTKMITKMTAKMAAKITTIAQNTLPFGNLAHILQVIMLEMG